MRGTRGPWIPDGVRGGADGEGRALVGRIGHIEAGRLGKSKSVEAKLFSARRCCLRGRTSTVRFLRVVDSITRCRKARRRQTGTTDHRAHRDLREKIFSVELCDLVVEMRIRGFASRRRVAVSVRKSPVFPTVPIVPTSERAVGDQHRSRGRREIRLGPLVDSERIEKIRELVREGVLVPIQSGYPPAFRYG